VLTEISFQPKDNGVLQFRALDYLPPDVVAICDKAVAERKTIDVLTGATDVPFRGALTHQPAQEAPPPVETLRPPPFNTPPAAISAPSQPPATASGERRRRRTKAEMEAERAGTGNAPPTASQPAPFLSVTGPGANAPFGVVSGAPTPNSEMQGMLNLIFNKP